MKKENVLAIIFYGSLWGIIEATLGYVLHWIPAFVSGSILFPIASVLMVRLYRKTNETSSIFFASIIAAFLKGFNFFLPNLSIWKVINPMIAILVEATVLLIAMHFVKKDISIPTVAALFLTGIAWRASYSLVFGIEYWTLGNLSPMISSLANIVDFVLVSGAIGGVFVVGFYFLNLLFDYKVSHQFRLSPIVAMSSFVIAIGVTLITIL